MSHKPVFNGLLDRLLKCRKASDEDSSEYDSKHVEIYNSTEQQRIKQVLKDAIAQIKTGTEGFTVLDFGAGTGNLTKHLLDLNTTVIAADISPRYLSQLKNKMHNPDKLELILLKGKNLSNIADQSFDMVATYSVLHHIPDYLEIINEFVRIVKPGGKLHDQ